MSVTRVGILGSTGSVGRQAVAVVERHPELFELTLLACGKDAKGLVAQAEKLGVKRAYCASKAEDKAALEDSQTYSCCDVVLNGIGGLSGVMPSFAVLGSEARLATANKESLVAAGKMLMAEAKMRGKTIIPVDSEHSTLFQCMEEKGNVKKLWLTASGGAFRDLTKTQIAVVGAQAALAHPNWVMGKKITVDCATLMNKGMEIIEAERLFGVDTGVIMHRESIIHSLVEFKDGSMKASLSSPDMALPIQYALTYPARYASGIKPLNLAEIGSLSFSEPDTERFPCLSLAEEVKKLGDGEGAVLCAADEVAVEQYLGGKIGFYGVSALVEAALTHFAGIKTNSPQEIAVIEAAVREYTLSKVGEIKC